MIFYQKKKQLLALIKFANKKTKAVEIEKDEPIRKLKNLDQIHCLTVDLPIDISCEYRNIISISKWNSSFSSPGGVNLPKKIKCVGSNGKEYPQLLKGQDDLRQDAVMQQVFCIMNDMLSTSNITKKSRLNVRTYIVVPLSQRSGVLEWCSDTMPLSEYLVGTPKSRVQGAHDRYRPNDWKPSVCRSQLGDLKSKWINI